MRSAKIRLSIVAVLALVATAVLPAQGAGSRGRARFWAIPPGDYLESGDATFPETSSLPNDREIGVAFSGGGVRSASETAGELRGLREIGLLGEVQYTSAVSGGAWALIPWTFSGEPDLLGRHREPEDLRFDEVVKVPNGTLAGALIDVYLLPDALKEIGLNVWYYNVAEDARDLERAVRGVLRQARTADRTYATLLSRALIGRLIPGALTSDFAWNAVQEAEIRKANGGALRRPIIYPQPGRPFMIANANVLNVSRDFKYPGAVPIEMTPMYVGARQQIGGVFGGMYAWPMAYNAATARAASDAPGFLEFTHDDTHARITLADVAASTGAAPLFFVAGGNGLAFQLRDVIRSRAGAYFPTFSHLALRGTTVLQPKAVWPHADGGARDNLGITALLARHVRKIIAFVNVDKPDFTNTEDIRALFIPGAASPTADKSDLVVFKGGAAAYETITKDFADDREAGRPLVSCGTFDVAGSRTFNIRPYDGVSICWVFPDRSGPWLNALEPPLKALVEGRCQDCGDYGRFTNLPWFDTFFQNHDVAHLSNVGVLRLTTAQVNLESDLLSWTVKQAEPEIRAGLGIPK